MHSHMRTVMSKVPISKPLMFNPTQPSPTPTIIAACIQKTHLNRNRHLAFSPNFNCCKFDIEPISVGIVLCIVLPVTSNTSCTVALASSGWSLPQRELYSRMVLTLQRVTSHCTTTTRSTKEQSTINHNQPQATMMTTSYDNQQSTTTMTTSNNNQQPMMTSNNKQQ